MLHGDRIVDWSKLTDQEKKDLFKPTPQGKVTYKRISPTHYKVKIEDINSPVTLAFSETYDSLWELDGRQSYRLYSLINGFDIEAPGEYDVVFSAQKYIIPGLLISGTALALIAAFFLTTSGKLRKRK